ncbi:MAG: ABC transporter ATP-binding protein [Acidimicrobiales bacterium]|nr:ABC transporter ATP-binding protein [Acidimicrobiales bacterium]
MAGELLLSVKDLEVRFRTEDGIVQAVNGVSFDIRRGQVFAVVGESGSGKSVTAMSILGLLPKPPADVTGGRVLWRGEDLLQATPDRLREVRGGEIAMIFQDPLTALNPVHTVGRQVGEMVMVHRGMNKKQARQHAIEMLELVGIPQPDKRVDMHPHEFSGGMRQRVMIAMAIACKPQLLIADEPTTALDVTVQAQVLEVLLGIKDEIDSAIMLITHDLGVVAGMADEVMVMYAGRQAERGTVDQIFYRCAHPYTVGLMESLPRLDSPDDELKPIGGQPPSLITLPSGCAFHPRCRYADLQGRCVSTVPDLAEVDGSGMHRSACFFAEELIAGELEVRR